MLVAKLMTFVRRIVVLICVASMAACSITQTKEDHHESQMQAQLDQQQTLLADYSTNLVEQGETQSLILEQLKLLQDSVDKLSISTVANSQNNKTVSPPPNTSSPAKKRRSKTLNVFGKAIVGRVEYLWVDGLGEYLKARIDTGAKYSSLHATDIQSFERNGKPWVRFNVDEVGLEAPLIRHAKIRQASVEESERRPVVNLLVQLGELTEETEFTLSDRGEMIYPVLLGRNFLQDVAIVDVARKFTRRRDPQRVNK